MKTLKQILEVYSPKSADEKRFVNKHITIKHADRNGNGDDVFTASNVKTIDRAKEKKGHDAKASEAVYEETKKIDETVGAKLRKIIPGLAKHQLNKKMDAQNYEPSDTNKQQVDKDAKFARYKKIYDKNFKKEEVEQIDELSKSTLTSYRDKANNSQRKAGDSMEKHHSLYGDGDKKEFRKHQITQNKRALGLGRLAARGVSPFKEEVEVNEVLKVSHGAGAWIKDFQDSDNPKFTGKSKEQRKQQALAAFYAARRAGKE